MFHMILVGKASLLVQFCPIQTAPDNRLCLICVQVKGVILDPSCSGSGTTVSRMDHLLPGSAAAAADGLMDEQEQQRVEQLAKFQVGCSVRNLRVLP